MSELKTDKLLETTALYRYAASVRSAKGIIKDSRKTYGVEASEAKESPSTDELADKF